MVVRSWAHLLQSFYVRIVEDHDTQFSYAVLFKNSFDVVVIGESSWKLSLSGGLIEHKDLTQRFETEVLF